MKDIPDKGVFCVCTWLTLRSQLHQMKPESPDFLQRKLGELPPKGSFVQLNQVLELFGPEFGSWEDFLKVSPCEAQLHQVIQSLENASNRDKLQDALVAIQGKNNSHYVRPLASELAEGARTILETQLHSLPPDHM